MVNFLVTVVLQLVLGVLGMIVVCAFSRWREFRADAGSANLAGKNDMIAALQRLGMQTKLVDNQPALAAMKISGGVGKFFATHPPIEDRIAALRAL